MQTQTQPPPLPPEVLTPAPPVEPPPTKRIDHVGLRIAAAVLTIVVAVAVGALIATNRMSSPFGSKCVDQAAFMTHINASSAAMEAATTAFRNGQANVVVRQLNLAADELDAAAAEASDFPALANPVNRAAEHTRAAAADWAQANGTAGFAEIRGAVRDLKIANANGSTVPAC